MFKTSSPAVAPSAIAPHPHALDRLTRFGWSGGFALILLGLTLSSLLLGYFVVYWRHADMDFMVVYNALVLNDGKPQEFFDHPGYLTILTVEYWFRLMHQLGLMTAWRLADMPPAADRLAFDSAMTDAIHAGRVVAWLTASAVVVGFAALSRRIFSDWRVALLATFAFAFSGGIAVHIRILRTEMIAAGLTTLAFLLLIVVARRGTNWRPLWIGVAAALCMLAMENKVHAVLLIAALPVLLVSFGGEASASSTFWRRRGTGFAGLGFAAMICGVALTLAWPILQTGFDLASMSATTMHPVVPGRLGIYQTALGLWIVAAMLAFAALWRVSPFETAASMLAVIAGAGFALLVLLVEWSPVNAVAVLNPVERMVSFAGLGSGPEASRLVDLIMLGLRGILVTLARWTFVLSTSPRPTIFLVWLVLPGIWLAVRRGQLQLAIQAGLLLLAALAIDTLGVQRGLKSEYFIFTDPLIIIAAALLLDAMLDLAARKWAWPIAAALFAAHIVVSQAEPVRHMLKRSGPEEICAWNTFYLRLLPMPYCKAPT